MHNSFFTETSPFKKLLFSAFIVIASFFVILFIGVFISLPIFNISFAEFESRMSSTSPESISLLKYFQVLSSIGLFIVPAFVIAYVYHSNHLEYLSIKVSPKYISIFLILIIAFLIIPFINFTGYLNSHLDLPSSLDWLDQKMRESENAAEKLTLAFLNVSTIGGLLFNLFMIAILPAIGEELMFRGIIQRIFTDWTKNVHWGIFLGAFLFSFIHLQFYGFVPRLLLGMLFGYLLHWSKSIWLPIIAHFFNNGIAVVTYYYANINKTQSSIDSIGTEEYITSILSLFFSLAFLYLVWKSETKQQYTVNK